jgi:diguanylate cyclase (GGDEF)-like protein
VASPESLASVVIAIPIAVVLAEVLAAKTEAMRRAQCSLEASAVLLEQANLTDDLTGVGNRRRANTLLDVMVPGDAVALIDLDHFKVVNDTLGHAEGDRVLMELGGYLLRAVRDADCVARYGGEEFLILMRGAGKDAAAIVERLLTGWRATGSGVTLSAGVAIHVIGCGPAATFERADGLLYQAKAGGRDRVVAEQVGLPGTIFA